MTKLSISFKMGDGSIIHNFREYDEKGFKRHDNIDRSKTKNNIIIKKEDIKDFYDKEFATAVADYNAKQKRKDRCINNSYYEHMFGDQTTKWVAKAKTGKYETKSFYEDVVQLGTMNDTAVGSDNGKIAVEILKEYAEGFALRNPHLKQVNSVIHLDEKTPHLHNDWVPICDEGYKKGLSKQVALAKALEQQGFPISMHQISDWRIRERKILEEICKEHGIEVKTTEEIDRPDDMPDMTPQQYKLWKENAKTIEEQKEQIGTLKDKLEEVEREKTKQSELAKLWQERAETFRNEVNKLTEIKNEIVTTINELINKYLPNLSKRYNGLENDAMDLRLNIENNPQQVQNYRNAEKEFIEEGKKVVTGLEKLKLLQKQTTSFGSQHSLNRDEKGTHSTSEEH